MAGFFTLLYGLNFDNKQQAEWLISMFVSMAQDVLVSQPIKVILMAVLFALLLKKPQDEDDDVINAELARDEEWLEQNLPHVQTGNAKVADTQCHRPPDKVFVVVKVLSRQGHHSFGSYVSVIVLNCYVFRLCNVFFAAFLFFFGIFVLQSTKSSQIRHFSNNS